MHTRNGVPLVTLMALVVSMTGGCGRCPINSQCAVPFPPAQTTHPVPAANAPKADAGTLFLYCGAAMRKPVAEISKLFRERTGIKVEPTYTGSGCLLAQIEMADKGDLFMPGEDWFMEQAVERGRILDWRTVAYFVPVIMVERGNPQHIKSLRDLMRPGLRVGIGEPKACAIGHFTVRLVEASGIPWRTFEPYVTAHFATAPELGNAVKLKAVDACIQWDSIAALYRDDTEVVALPPSSKTVSKITLGVLRTATNPQMAKRYLAFVAGPEGQAVMRKHHFTTDLRHPTFAYQPQEQADERPGR